MSNLLDLIHRVTSSKPAVEAVTDARNAIKDTGFFTSKRFLVLLAFLCGLWFLHALLSADVVKIAAYVVVAYIVCDTVSKSIIAAGNAWIRVNEVRADVEYEKMRDPVTGKLPSDKLVDEAK